VEFLFLLRDFFVYGFRSNIMMLLEVMKLPDFFPLLHFNRLLTGLIHFGCVFLLLDDFLFAFFDNYRLIPDDIFGSLSMNCHLSC